MPRKKSVSFSVAVDHPDPSEIKRARLAANLTQTQAGQSVFGTLRTWQDWESAHNERKMPLAAWHLFLLIHGLHPTAKLEGVLA